MHCDSVYRPDMATIAAFDTRTSHRSKEPTLGGSTLAFFFPFRHELHGCLAVKSAKVKLELVDDADTAATTAKELHNSHNSAIYADSTCVTSFALSALDPLQILLHGTGTIFQWIRL
jgi:hypothetical protein